MADGGRAHTWLKMRSLRLMPKLAISRSNCCVADSMLLVVKFGERLG
jgi:hypothetical protein